MSEQLCPTCNKLELKTCPFCGMFPETIFTTHGLCYIRCSSCTITTGVFTMDYVIRFWNTRHAT